MWLRGTLLRQVPQLTSMPRCSSSTALRFCFKMRAGSGLVRPLLHSKLGRRGGKIPGVLVRTSNAGCPGVSAISMSAANDDAHDEGHSLADTSGC